MEKTEFEKITARLAELSPEQVTSLLQRIRLLHKRSMDNRSETLPGEDWLLQGIVVKLKRAGLLSEAGMPVLLRSKGYAAYRKRSVQLRQDLDGLLAKHSNRSAARLLLAGLVASALLGWLAARRIPATPNLLLLNADKAFTALSEQWPGYIEANLFHIVVSGLLQKEPQA